MAKQDSTFVACEGTIKKHQCRLGNRVAVGLSPAIYNLPLSIAGAGYGSALTASEEEDPKN